QHQRPDGQNDSKQPKVFPQGQYCIALQVYKLAETVCQIEAGCGQRKINKPQIDGKDPFPLVDHL
ncbi:MAG TPA: hypothetical protein VFR18_26560, partial [Terriglobia bacterium]|nr:hypothetical protein [Terriglobia bacterium]